MRVLITGVAGFLGSSLAKRLVELGHEVVGLDILHRNEAWRLGDLKIDYLWKNSEDVHQDDIPSHVIHCAASTDVPHTAASPRHAVNASIHGTVALLEACKRAMEPGSQHAARDPLKRVIVVSSYSAYGRVPHGALGITEENVLKPTTLYGAMKAAQEAIAWGFWQSNNVPVACIRLATLYGENSRATLPVALFMGKALKNEPITITGTGQQTRDQNYISNAVDGIIQALFKKEHAAGMSCGHEPVEISGRAYNIGSGHEITMAMLATLCIEAVRDAGHDTSSKIVYTPPRFGEEGRLFLDNGVAENVFGYKPAIGLEKGLKRTAKWMVKRIS
ncbi:MAG: NAD-dependent epimerase/dehydratase family protein [Dehalococcoidia bacterium]|nr:NAD-dependent epimerase/dehydratase family protein [Dehalococcoidia bacterium]